MHPVKGIILGEHKQGETAPSGPQLPHSRGLSITNNDAPQSVGLLWTSDKLGAETSTLQHTTFTRDIYALIGIRTHSLSRRAAADRRLRPRGHSVQYDQ